MSLCSTNSMMSVSIFGEELDVDSACDKVFKQLQDSLNLTHLRVRELMMSEDRGESFMESVEIADSLNTYCDDLSDLLKELKSVGKQVLGKCPPEEKVAYAAHKQKMKDSKAARDLERVNACMNDMGIKKNGD